MNAVLVIDKPAGMTSHDVVSRVRRILKERSVGHLGTLDPMATGVLPLVVGKLTRLAQFYNASEKTYEGEIRLGFATDTYDADGEPTTPVSEVRPSLEQVQQAAARFRGIITQTPPPFSAKKIHGVPAYKLARKHRQVELEPVQVEVKEFKILSMDGDLARFQAKVASGTYLRSVAHDLGQLLGTGAHLASLRRTALAEFDLGDARTLGEVEAAASQSAGDAARQGSCGDARVEAAEPNASTLADVFVHPRRLLPAFPAVTANEESVALIRAGRAVNLPEMSRARQIKVFYGQTELVAIATRIAGTLFHPKVVFPIPPAPGCSG